VIENDVGGHVGRPAVSSILNHRYRGQSPLTIEQFVSLRATSCDDTYHRIWRKPVIAFCYDLSRE
jgi:hypothetical protein